jgi:hypothetical protein
MGKQHLFGNQLFPNHGLRQNPACPTGDWDNGKIAFSLEEASRGTRTSSLQKKWQEDDGSIFTGSTFKEDSSSLRSSICRPMIIHTARCLTSS